MRLDRFLAKTLLETRTNVKKYIRNGRVFVNDKPIKTDGYIVNTLLDVIRFDDTLLVYEEFQYFLINKPQGYVCANDDRINPTIINYDPLFAKLNLHTVGRLDKDTTGALLLTNDGRLTHKLISPKQNVPKVYEVVVDKILDLTLISAFASGININNEYVTRPAELIFLSPTKAQVTIIEGKYHQIKRMFRFFGYEVITLHRVSFAKITVDDLEIGAYRPLTKRELTLLFED